MVTETLAAYLTLLGIAIVATLGLVIAVRWRRSALTQIARNALLANMTDLVMVIDQRGCIADANPAAGQVLERPARDLIGQPIQRVLAAFPDLLQNYGDAPQAEFELVTGEGPTRHYYEVRISPIAGDRRQFSGRLIIARDITKYKQAQQDLHRQALIVENITESVIVTEQSGAIIEANPATEKLFGFTTAELLGQTAALWHLPEEAEAIRDGIVKGLSQQGRWSGEVNFVRKDRTKGMLEVDVVPMTDGAGNRVVTVGVSRDITERKRAEATLHAQKKLLENLVAVARATAEGPTLDATLQNVVQEAARLTGAERGSLLLLTPDGESITRSILIRGQTQQLEELSLARRVLGHGLAAWIVRERRTALIPDATHDTRWLTLPGQPYTATSVLGVPILSAASLVGILILTHSEANIFTEDQVRLLEAAADQIALALRNAQIHDEQRRLAEQQATLYTVLRSVGGHLDPETVAHQAVETIARVTDWTIVSVIVPDETGADLVIDATTIPDRKGYRINANEGIIGRAYRTAKTQVVPNVVVDPDYVAGNAATRSELSVPLRRGERVLGVLNIESPLRAAFDDDAVQLAASLADAISLALENAHLFKESLKTADRLREVGRLKSAFLANMSHELRTPLQAIMGYTEELLAEARDAGQARQLTDLKKIESAASHLQTLINDTLDLSKIEAGRMQIDPETFHVRSLVDNVAATIHPLAVKNDNVLQINCPSDLPTMYADPTRVRQVLINLLGNAAKFTQQGSITLTVTREADPGPQAGNQWLNFRVTDTGIGMNEQQMHHLFEEFQQGDISVSRKYGGTGLGLALSRRLCQIMGGDITATSEAGKGSTFVARLPVKINRLTNSESLAG